MSLRDQPTEKSLQSFDEALLKGVHTSYPGSIVSYDPESKTCAVQIHYADFYATEGPEVSREDWTPIEDVPVLFPRGGGWSITWPLKNGDPVLVVFCERSIDEWFASDGASELSPALQVTHDAGDCIVIPGLAPRLDADFLADAENLIISGDHEFQVAADKVRLGTVDAAKPLALTEKVDARIDDLAGAINDIIQVLITANAAGGLVLTPPPAPLIGLASVNSETTFTDA